ncbi:MAG: DUF1571 domain-containing protein [Gemmataceae bacterium]|nr:DUF1571 domain-containing protein [Gemmataceae bacterium]
MTFRPILLACLVSVRLASGAIAQPPAAAPEQTLEQAIAFMQEARRNFSVVKDYSCTLVSRENVAGKLQDENIIQAKFRVQPNSVAMRWLAPAKSAGQEVVWIQGQNNNKMKVHSRGLLKVAGWVSIDPRDPRATEHSRHTITEAGLGNTIDESLRQWDRERQTGKTQVRIAEYTFDSRRCWRMELIRTEQRPEFYAYRTVVYLDKESKLPIRNENYFFPRQGGPAEGELMESFSYIGLRFNTGLADRDFEK